MKLKASATAYLMVACHTHAHTHTTYNICKRKGPGDGLLDRGLPAPPRVARGPAALAPARGLASSGRLGVFIYLSSLRPRGPRACAAPRRPPGFAPPPPCAAWAPSRREARTLRDPGAALEFKQFFLVCKQNCKHFYSFLGPHINSCGIPARRPHPAVPVDEGARRAHRLRAERPPGGGGAPDAHRAAARVMLCNALRKSLMSDYDGALRAPVPGRH